MTERRAPRPIATDVSRYKEPLWLVVLLNLFTGFVAAFVVGAVVFIVGIFVRLVRVTFPEIAVNDAVAVAVVAVVLVVLYGIGAVLNRYLDGPG